MKQIPLFPDLRPLELGDQARLRALLQSYPPEISEFTFTNLFAWRGAYGFGLSRIENSLLIISVKKSRAFDIFDPLGPEEEKARVISQCFAQAPNGSSIRFSRLPEKTIALLDEGALCLRVKEDRDNFDYLYLAKDLKELKGVDYDGKRNFVKRFTEGASFELIELTQANVEECLSFEEEWCLERDCQHVEGLSQEKTATEEMLRHFGELGIQGLMIRINGKVEAVTLGEALNRDTFVIHIEKANGRYIGIYQAINQIFSSRISERFVYINREQDLGVLGLRQAKLSYHPHRLVKKFSLAKTF